MIESEAAGYLAGVMQVEGAQSSSPTNLHVISGEVVENSSGGKVLVNIDGRIFSESDSQNILVNTIGGLKTGDMATVILAGQEKHGMVPLAIGAVGSVDRVSQAADYAEERAAEAKKSADQAAADASKAAGAAATAQEKAEEAENSAVQANTYALKAIDDASVAQKAAEDAQKEAESARDSADVAKSNAEKAIKESTTASIAAKDALTSANAANINADRANESANSALRQLSNVEDVLGTLEWVTEHGTYALTTDTEIQNGKVYYTRSGSGTEDDPYVYTGVAEPNVENISNYYELHIDEALSEYVSSHLSLTDAGLFVMKDGSSYKLLITNNGIQIQNALGDVAASYGASGTSFSQFTPYYVGNQDAYIAFMPATPSEPAYITIGGSNVRIGSNKKLSDVLTSLDVSATQTATGATITVGDQTVTLSNGVKGDKGDKGDPGSKGDKGDKGDDGAQGYSVISHLVRGSLTEANWSDIYGKIGHNDQWVNNGTPAIAYPTRVGDLFVVTGTATDSGNSWTATYRITSSVTSGSVPATCISSTKALKGSTGAAGKDAQWYVGTALTHTSGTATLAATSTSGAVVGSMYLNTSTGNIYRCTAVGTNDTWQYVGNTATGIDVGGRNLLFDSGSLKAGSDSNGSSGAVVDGGYSSASKEMHTTTAWSGPHLKLGAALTRAGIKVGDTVTLSIWLSTDSDTEVTTPPLYLYRATKKEYTLGVNGYLESSPTVKLVKGRWVRLWCTFDVTDYSLAATTTRFEFSKSTDYTQIWSAPKLEKGNTATDWTPAPEDVDSAISTAQTTANTANTNAATAQSQLNVSRTFYATSSTAADTAAKVATITPATTAFTLEIGRQVFVKFSATNSAAVGSLTLNVNGTGAKAIKYRLNNGGQANLPAVGYLVANQLHKFTYDGTYWVLDVNYNTDTINRTRWQNVIKAATAVTAGHLICGTSAGYKNIAAGIAFDLSYPLLYAGSAIAANATGDNNYLQINGVSATGNGTVESAAQYSVLYLKGTVSGNTFTISASPFLTCKVPTTDDGYSYIPLGMFYNSTTAIYFNSSKELYAYRAGMFGPVSVREASQAAKTATNYIATIANGIMVHPEGDTNNGWRIADALELLKDGMSQIWAGWRNGLAAVRIGIEDEYHSIISGNSFGIFYDEDRIFNVKMEDEVTRMYLGVSDGVTSSTVGSSADSVILTAASSVPSASFVLETSADGTTIKTGSKLLNIDGSLSATNLKLSGSITYDNGTTAYPLFIQSAAPTASSTFPVSPCFVYSTSNNGLYYYAS